MSTLRIRYCIVLVQLLYSIIRIVCLTFDAAAVVRHREGLRYADLDDAAGGALQCLHSVVEASVLKVDLVHVPEGKNYNF